MTESRSCSLSDCLLMPCLHLPHSVTAVVVATVTHYHQLGLVLSHEATERHMRSGMPEGLKELKQLHFICQQSTLYAIRLKQIFGNYLY